MEHNGSAVLAERSVVVGAVLDALTMHWENVVQASLQVLAIIARQEGHFSPVMADLLDRQVLVETAVLLLGLKEPFVCP